MLIAWLCVVISVSGVLATKNIVNSGQRETAGSKDDGEIEPTDNTGQKKDANNESVPERNNTLSNLQADTDDIKDKVEQSREDCADFYDGPFVGFTDITETLSCESFRKLELCDLDGQKTLNYNRKYGNSIQVGEEILLPIELPVGVGWPDYSKLCCACGGGIKRNLTCPPGQAYDFAAYRCEPCAAGTFIAEGVSQELQRIPLECDYCSAGKYTNEPGSSQCHPCPQGKYSSRNKSVSCDSCSEGYVSSAGSASNESCQLCAPGKFWKFWRVDIEFFSCEPCSAGKYQKDAGRIICNDCSPGTYSNVSSHVCESCQPGTFASEDGESMCRHCLSGTFAEEEGATECTQCQAGSFEPNTGSTACSECPPGKMTFKQGAKSEWMCLCPSGFMKSPSRTNLCMQCSEGLMCAWEDCFENIDVVKGKAEDMVLNSSRNQTLPSILAGYWASSDGTPSTIVQSIFKCTSHRRCPGGSPGSCHENMQGISCARCRADYFHNQETDVCESCGKSISWVTPALSILVTWLILGYFTNAWNKRAAQTEAGEGVLASVTVGILISFVQTLGVYSLMPLAWPDMVEKVFRIFRALLFDVAFVAPECIFGDYVATYYILELLMPVCLGFLLFSFYPLSQVFRKIEFSWIRPFTLKSIVSFSGMVVQIVFISMATSVMSIVVCGPNPSGKRTLKRTPYLICFQDGHWPLVVAGSVAALIYVVLPLAVFIHACIMLPERVVEPDIALLYKSLYFKFHPAYFWYGFLHMLRSFLLALVNVLATDNAHMQYSLMLAIINGSLILQLLFCPYVDRYANLLENMELTILVVILVACTWFLSEEGVGTLAGVKESDTKLFLGFLILSLVVICFASVGMTFLWAMTLAMRPDLAHRYAERRLDAIIPNLRGFCELVGKLDDQDLRDLLSVATYTDLAAARKMCLFGGLEACGHMPKELLNRRLPRNPFKKRIRKVSMERLTRLSPRAPSTGSQRSSTGSQPSSTLTHSAVSATSVARSASDIGNEEARGAEFSDLYSLDDTYI